MLMPLLLPPPRASVVFCLGLILKEVTRKCQPVQNALLPSSSTGGRAVKLLIQELQNRATQNITRLSQSTVLEYLDYLNKAVA